MEPKLFEPGDYDPARIDDAGVILTNQGEIRVVTSAAHGLWFQGQGSTLRVEISASEAQVAIESLVTDSTSPDDARFRFAQKLGACLSRSRLSALPSRPPN